MDVSGAKMPRDFEDEAAARHYRPIFDEICKNPPPIKTAAGAVAAIPFFHFEWMGFGIEKDMPPLLLAVLTFLEGAANG